MQFTKIQTDAVLAGLRLLQAALTGGLVRPNDGEIGDILTDVGTHAGLSADDIDALCESLQFETPEEPRIAVDLNVYDDEGNVVDGTTSELTRGQISDIVDHASQFILARRHDENSTTAQGMRNELEEALVAANVIDAG